MDFNLEMTVEQLDSLEHLPVASYKEQQQQTCPNCRKVMTVSIVRMGSQADQSIETSLQWNTMISWLVQFPPKLRIRMKPEHFEAMRREKKILIHALCPKCQKTLPFTISLREP